MPFSLAVFAAAEVIPRSPNAIRGYIILHLRDWNVNTHGFAPTSGTRSAQPKGAFFVVAWHSAGHFPCRKKNNVIAGLTRNLIKAKPTTEPAF
jgi:hypothetical protein